MGFFGYSWPSIGGAAGSRYAASDTTIYGLTSDRKLSRYSIKSPTGVWDPISEDVYNVVAGGNVVLADKGWTHRIWQLRLP